MALLKEVVHHFRPAELPEIFGGILSQLTPGGRLTVATRPHRPNYPFFRAAAEVWREQQPDEKGRFIGRMFFAKLIIEAFSMTMIEFHGIDKIYRVSHS